MSDRINLLLRWTQWLIFTVLLVLQSFFKIHVSLWVLIPLLAGYTACFLAVQIDNTKKKRSARK